MTAIDAVAAPPRKRFARLKRVAPFFIFGPISGPLLAGVVFNFREGRPVLGSLYAVALAEVAFLLPYVTAWVGLKDVTAVFGVKVL